MEVISYTFVVLAAFMHATWNALIKVAVDRLILLTAVAFGQAALGLILVGFVPLPNQESWLYIFISTALNYAYFFFLYHAYKQAEFSHIYPFIRGLAPVMVAVGAYVAVGEVSNFIGVVIASAGICGLALSMLSGAVLNIKNIMIASFTALVIASYTISDGIGVRLNENPLSYIAWLFILEIPIVIFTVFYRRKTIISAVSNERWKLLGCAVFSALAYSLCVVASAYIPLVIVSTIRETSVIIAALIGVIFFKERPWKLRMVMSLVVFSGVALIAF